MRTGPDVDRDLLGVDAGSDRRTLRRAYLRAVKAAHPDRIGGDGAQLRAVIEAFKRLESPAWIPERPARETDPSGRGPPRLEINTRQAALGGWTRVTTHDRRSLSVRLPAGLRNGEHVRVDAITYCIAIRQCGGAAVYGDDVLMTVEVAAGLLAQGGRIVVRAPNGETTAWVTSAQGRLGFVRLAGRGLPARGGRLAGDLIVRLKTAAASAADTPLQIKRRAFAQSWAA